METSACWWRTYTSAGWVSRKNIDLMAVVPLRTNFNEMLKENIKTFFQENAYGNYYLMNASVCLQEGSVLSQKPFYSKVYATHYIDIDDFAYSVWRFHALTVSIVTLTRYINDITNLERLHFNFWTLCKSRQKCMIFRVWMAERQYQFLGLLYGFTLSTNGHGEIVHSRVRFLCGTS